MGETPETKVALPIVPCTITIENVNQNGMVTVSKTYKDSKLRVGRNEFRDIQLLVETKTASLKYSVQEIKTHHRFIKEGKATISLKNSNVNLLICNAPPTMLMTLIKSLTTKVSCSKDEKKLPARERLLSNLPSTFDDISPMTSKEYKRTNKSQSPATPLINKNSQHLGESPVSSKRKRQDFSGRPRPKASRLLTPVILNYDQQRVITAIKYGMNVFFTGSAGTGKSFLLKRLVGILPPDVTAITASTGVAACAIGGTTVHSFAGIGAGNYPLKKCIDMALRKTVAQQWRKCRYLIIDEISMIDADFFTKLEAVARAVRGNEQPFGGIQLILSGDFLQLPPVSNNGKPSFPFESPAWSDCINVSLELGKVLRQNESNFINILQEIRMGRCSEESKSILLATKENCLERDGIEATLLCTHREDAEIINSRKLKQLKGELHLFQAVDSDPHLKHILESQIPVPEVIHLKVGAQVILMKNLDIGKGLVNGARGVVVGFENNSSKVPVVKFMCNLTIPVKHEKWVIKSAGGIQITRRQIPLKLGWSFSIHKSQGMTLDCVEMSLSKVFEAGQAYVALSRARSLQGLKIRDFSSACIRAHPQALKFYRNLETTKLEKQSLLDDFTAKSQS